MSITVLLVDDHAIVRDGLRFLLETQPDIVVVGDVMNEYDAVQLASQTQPNIVIIDVVTPELNEIEAAYQIHRICPQSQIIILSMYATIEHVVRALKAGASGYLLKESVGMELVDAVQAVNVGHRYLSQKILDMMVENYVR